MRSQKIAIIGGGMGGLTAAFDLSAPDLIDKYDITVYQMGWRLGGKCATGRNPFKNMRIEEHGIHAFAGSYYNALSMMERVFDELDRPKNHKLPDFATAFIKERSSFLWDYHDDKMKKWISHYPPRLENTLQSTKFSDLAEAQSGLSQWTASAASLLRHFIQRPILDASTPAAKHIDNFMQELDIFERNLPAIGSNNPANGGIPWGIYDGILTPMPRPDAKNDADRRDLDRIEFTQVILRGVRDDNLEAEGFSKVDGEDFDVWLERHGASSELLGSPLVTGTMFVTYQFPRGDMTQKPVMSASSFVQWILRSTSYIDAPYYLFEAGSGETLIEPLYELLKKRGVTFKLFHELTNIELDAQGLKAAGLTFNVQAEPLEKRYDPLIDVKGLRAWPNAPLYERLSRPEKLRNLDLEAPGVVRGIPKSLMAGKDFDKVVLAIPPRAIMSSARNLLGTNRAWDNLEKMAVTATQSMQLWFTDPIETLTQHSESFFVSGNYRSGLHGIAEFQNILQHEDWPESVGPKGLVYFSGVMTLPHREGEMSVRSLADLKAYHTAETMLASSASEVFPNAKINGSAAIDYAFDYSVLFPPGQLISGVDRLAQHYIRGNVLPSELYTQAPPGTKALRIDPLSPPLENLTVAGDWVDTRLNVGSVEGAVIGGRLAACYIEPSLDRQHILGIQLT